MKLIDTCTGLNDEAMGRVLNFAPVRTCIATHHSLSVLGSNKSRRFYKNPVVLHKIVRSPTNDIRVALKVRTVQRENVGNAETNHRCDQSGIMDGYAHNLMIE